MEYSEDSLQVVKDEQLQTRFDVKNDWIKHDEEQCATTSKRLKQEDGTTLGIDLTKQLLDVGENDKAPGSNSNEAKQRVKQEEVKHGRIYYPKPD